MLILVIVLTLVKGIQRNLKKPQEEKKKISLETHSQTKYQNYLHFKQLNREYIQFQGVTQKNKHPVQMCLIIQKQKISLYYTILTHSKTIRRIINKQTIEKTLKKYHPQILIKNHCIEKYDIRNRLIAVGIGDYYIQISSSDIDSYSKYRFINEKLFIILVVSLCKSNLEYQINNFTYIRNQVQVILYRICTYPDIQLVKLFLPHQKFKKCIRVFQQQEYIRICKYCKITLFIQLKGITDKSYLCINKVKKQMKN
ncbi:hypothetical protein pb186bvf_010710 [Paramecium bursaria]